MNSPILPGSKFGTAERTRSFTWSHIALRLVWNVTWLLLAAWTPPQFYAWRRLLLNLFGAKLAPGARVYGSARVWYPPNLTMGCDAVLGWRSFCYSMGPITLSDYAIVSQFSHLVSGSHDAQDENFQLFVKPIVIGAHAWIAANAFVGPGVTVGDGAVLGACGVAVRDLAPWTIYGGNPAKPLKPRGNFTLVE
jgi:putative colanic acid biosynthesis acetyltransferase WcaF